MNPEQLLQQLAPLRNPDPIGFWPLAPVWWVALLLLAIALAAIVVWFLKHRRKNAYRRYGVVWIDELEASGADVQALSKALKSQALLVFDSSTVAGLSGESWPMFLRESCPKLDRSALTILSRIHAPDPGLVTESDWQNARLWMTSHEVPDA